MTENRRNMSDHDLLIRIDERVETLQDDVKEMNGLKRRVTRLEVILGLLPIGGGTIAGIMKGLGVY